MLYKCSGHIVLEADDDPEVLCVDRMANDPALGLKLLCEELIVRLSRMPGGLEAWKDGLCLLAWVDPVIGLTQADEIARGSRGPTEAR